MRKIETMFERDQKTFRVLPILRAGAEWVANGEGIATRKWDGTCCLIKEGKLYKRYDGSKSRVLPADFLPAEGAESHWLGWRPVGDGPEDRWHNEATKFCRLEEMPDGTYELIGPAVNRNPEKWENHGLIKHGTEFFDNVPRHYEGLKEWLRDRHIEGIVFHHADGRMVKIKRKDFDYRAVSAAK